jgi:NADH-quinone oxidoreductase subunit A
MYGGEYGGILLGLGLCLVLAIVFAGLSYVVSAKQADVEKVSAYECGFDPFDDTRKTFDVRFYLVAILFLIFDLEVSFLFPWVVSLGTLPLLGFWSMILFLVILTVGFIYEWRKGALDW